MEERKGGGLEVQLSCLDVLTKFSLMVSELPLPALPCIS